MINIDCPFDIYEILINPIDYEINVGDEAIVFATDYDHAYKAVNFKESKEKEKKLNQVRD